MEGDHGASHGFPGGVSIEATVDLKPLVKERNQPARVGPDAGSGDASVLGMEGKATDGVDGRLTEDDGRDRVGGNGKEAQVFFGTRGHTPPGDTIGSAEFGADGNVFLSPQQEDGIGPAIGVEGAALDERLDQEGGETTLLEQVMSDATQSSGIWRGQFQTGFGKGLIGWGCRMGKMAGQPLEGFVETELVQMDDQVDGAATAHPAVPIHELGAGDRQDSLRGLPLGLVERIGLGAPDPKHRGQRDGPQLISSFPNLLVVHPLE